MWVFIVNPVAGNGKGRKAFEKLQHTDAFAELDCVYYFSEYEGHAEEIAGSLSQFKDLSGLIVIGGDGTIHEVINGLKDLRIPVGFIPGGSGNDFARGIGLKSNPELLLEQMLQALELRDYWLGTYVQRGEAKRYFINSMGFGFDAETAHVANQSSYKKLFNRIGFGTGSYIMAILQVLMRFKPFELEITLDEETHTIENCWLLSVGNHPFYGGGMKIMPNARVQPEKISVLLVHSLPKWKVLALFMTVFTGMHHKIKVVELLEASSLTVRVKEPIYRQVDGQTTTCLHTEINKQKDAISVILPK